ncbi:MAG: polysaccharide biosynthesis tyrosine autokinase [Immundisolibacter sp.]|uniref:polysaccharide biosynthesis tyrosine autokinase n=1 Tax=Immundisolibacter sp. TaxID=1934948 RepID=UPI0019A3271F|nr:polysaccharide biosynthesis tyrosine autokinase [Immundisolibacter sp.]MBC7162747.1 polysaccharide biosynthesis tyrosine autokinase [Immundisolibacter sp.]
MKPDTTAGHEPAPPAADRIGALLVQEGKLASTDLTRIAEYQKQHAVRFGEAAQALGLLSGADLDSALAEQFGYPWKPGSAATDPTLYALAQPFGHQAEQLRALRMRLSLAGVGRAEGHPALAVLSPQDGDGRSTLAANLAVSFAELGLRTLLVDADLRRPSQHTLFRSVVGGGGLSDLLAGRGCAAFITPLPGFSGLAVLPSGPVPPNATELLARPALQTFLSDVADRFDLVILDTPPTGPGGDAYYIAAAARAALLVARRNHTSLTGLDTLTQTLAATGIPVLGVVMNRG